MIVSVCDPLTYFMNFPFVQMAGKSRVSWGGVGRAIWLHPLSLFCFLRIPYQHIQVPNLPLKAGSEDRFCSEISSGRVFQCGSI